MAGIIGRSQRRRTEVVPEGASNVRQEPALVRWIIIAIVVVFLGVFLVLPLVTVFQQALAHGVMPYLEALVETDALAAIRLTLIVAAISVSLNLVFGVIAAWAIAKFDFFGKSVLITLIDLPFSVSPVISGLVFVLLFGAQGYFGVKPDLTIFGKCVTGGYPMAGGVGGRAEVISTFAPGIGGTGERAYIGGTLSANPLSCVAGYYALKEMERTDAPVIAGRAGDRLTKGLQAIIEKYDLPFVAYNQGSIVHLETSGVMLLDLKNPLKTLKEIKSRKHMIEEMGAAYMANGLITLAGSRMYTSMADTDEVIDEALEKFEAVLSSVEGI